MPAPRLPPAFAIGVALIAVQVVAACPPAGPRENTAPPPHDSSLRMETRLPVAFVDVKTRGGDIQRVRVEIAATDHARAIGLMYRRSLDWDAGMFFVFDRDAVQSFWMRNTLIPLDMIFLAADGTIVGIVHEAEPLTETPRSVGKPSRYVLEVPGGWSAARGVQPGDRVAVDAVLEALR